MKERNAPRVSLASLTHLREFAGFVEGSAHWSFDEWEARKVRAANRRGRKVKTKLERVLELL